MLRKILFIINPNSGTSNRGIDENLVRTVLEAEQWEIDFVTTQYAGNARQLAQDARDKVDLIIAVGGDGTVHEIASEVAGSNTALGIIPRGSGNGFSRFLRIPSNMTEALMVIKRHRTKLIDTIKLNEHRFVNIAGVGFDAHIAHLFKDYGTRGFLSYGKLVLREFQSYPGVKLKLNLNGSGVREEEAFVISFANSSQYGNNAHIAPRASIDDGLLDVCVVRRFPIHSSGSIVLRLFNKSLDRSKYYTYYQVPEVTFDSDQDLTAHVDGEPINLGKSGVIQVVPKSLKVIIP